MKSCFWQLACVHPRCSSSSISPSLHVILAQNSKTLLLWRSIVASQMPASRLREQGAMGSPSGMTVTQIRRTVDDLGCLLLTVDKLATNSRVLQSRLCVKWTLRLKSWPRAVPLMYHLEMNYLILLLGKIEDIELKYQWVVSLKTKSRLPLDIWSFAIT